MRRLSSVLGPLVLGLFCLTLASFGFAQDSTPAAASATAATVPHLVQYSGSVPGAQPGEPVNLRFALYAAQTGSDPIWSEAQQVTPDAKGRYAVFLGAATQGGLPQAAFNSAQAKWLGVAVGDDAEQPRVILVATPYSLKASDADTLGGHPLSDFKLAANANGKPDTAVDVTSITAGTGITVSNNGTASPTVAINANYLDTLAAGFPTLSGNNKFTGTNTLANTTINGNLTVSGNINSTYLNSIAATLPTLKGNNTLSGSNTFTGSASFSKPVTFAASQTFPGTISLSGNNSFTGTNTFSNPITFANGQTFPGAGTIAGITTSSPLSGSGTSGTVALSLNTSALETTLNGVYPQLSGTNIFSGSDSFSQPVAFAASQTFPNTISAITAGTGITAYNTNGSVNVSVNPAALEATYNTVYPQLSGGNQFNGNQDLLTGNILVAGGVVDVGGTPSLNAGNYQIGGVPMLQAAGGSSNIFLGSTSGNYSVTGSNLAATGYESLASVTSGVNNTADGARSLYLNTTGYDNVGIGTNAGQNNETGNGITAVGYGAGPDGSSLSLTNATAIGANAIVSENNALVLGGTGSNAVSVGIGTATPQSTLDVRGTGNFTGMVTFASSQTFPGTVTTSGSNTFTGSQTFNSSSTSAIYASDTSAGGSAIYGADTATGGIGMNGQGAGYGVYGQGQGNSANSVGVYGTSIASGGTGVYGNASTGNGVYGIATSGNGMYGTSTSGNGIVGNTAATGGPAGLFGNSTTTSVGSDGFPGIGVSGNAAGPSAYGVYGNSTGLNAFGVYGTAQGGNGIGLYGTANNSTGTGVFATGSFGVYGQSTYNGNAFSPTGVYGYVSTSNTSTQTQIGIAGDAPNTTYGVGVNGSGGAVGVQGSGFQGVVGTGSYAGVSGTSSLYGVYGSASGSNGYGVYGLNSATSGNAYGVYAETSSLVGYGLYGVEVAPSKTGAEFGGIGAAVWADTSEPYVNSNDTEYVSWGALLATADNNWAAEFYNNDNQQSTAIFQNEGDGGTIDDFAPVLTAGGRQGVCGIDGGGDVRCTGRLTTAVPLADKSQVAVYAVQSSENWFEDFGAAKLTAGKATVTIDPKFAQIVNTGVEYHVFLTPKGDSRGLFVQNEGPRGFEVRESGGGASNIAFDYRIVVKRSGHENERLTDVTAEMQRYTAPRDRMARMRAEHANSPATARKQPTPPPAPLAVPNFHRPEARPVPAAGLPTRAANEVPQR